MRNKKTLFIVFLLFITSPAFCCILPLVPSGRLGKSYEYYGMFIPMAMGVTEAGENYDRIQSYGFGMRSNFGLQSLDFGALAEIFLPGRSGSFIVYGFSADVKYGPVQTEDFLFSIDAGFSKAFPDTWIIRAGPAVNIPVFNGAFDLVLSAFYQYNTNRLEDAPGTGYSYDRVVFPAGSSFYYYAGVEIRGAMPDSSICTGIGYLQIPAAALPEEKVLSQVFVQFTGKFGLNPKKREFDPDAPGPVLPAEDGAADAASFATRARALLKSGQNAGAVAVLSEGLSAFPDDYLLNNLIANCFYKMKEKKKAYIYYRKALSINPADDTLREFTEKLAVELKNEK